MKLVHPNMRMQIELRPENMSELILENPDLFAEYLSELYGQICGEEGRFVLSEEGEILRMNVFTDCIINPYALDFNTKKILSKVYAAIKNEIQDTDLYLEYGELVAALHQFAANIVERIDTPLEYDVVTDAGILLKLLNFKIAEDNTFRIAGRVVDYLKILSEYTETKLIIFVNMKSYISCEDMKYLWEICAYLRLSVLMIESTEGYTLEGTKKYIVDKDSCEIYT